MPRAFASASTASMIAHHFSPQKSWHVRLSTQNPCAPLCCIAAISCTTFSALSPVIHKKGKRAFCFFMIFSLYGKAELPENSSSSALSRLFLYGLCRCFIGYQGDAIDLQIQPRLPRKVRHILNIFVDQDNALPRGRIA